MGGTATANTNGSSGTRQDATATGAYEKPTKSGVTGVTYNTKKDVWVAMVPVERQQYWIAEMPYALLPLAIDAANEARTSTKNELFALRNKYSALRKAVLKSGMDYVPKHVINSYEQAVLDYAQQTSGGPVGDFDEDDEEEIPQESESEAKKRGRPSRVTPDAAYAQDNLRKLLDAALAADDHVREMRTELRHTQRALETAEKDAAQRWNEVATLLIGSMGEESTATQSNFAALIEAVRNGR